MPPINNFVRISPNQRRRKDEDLGKGLWFPVAIMCPTVAPNHLDTAEISVQKDLAYFDDSRFDGSNSHDIKQLGYLIKHGCPVLAIYRRAPFPWNCDSVGNNSVPGVRTCPRVLQQQHGSSRIPGDKRSCRRRLDSCTRMQTSGLVSPYLQLQHWPSFNGGSFRTFSSSGGGFS